MPEGTDRVQVELAVGGMTCAARVQARLNKVTGVTASVNLSTERAYISAPARVSALDLAGVIQAAGYTAELARPAAWRPVPKWSSRCLSFPASPP